MISVYNILIFSSPVVEFGTSIVMIVLAFKVFRFLFNLMTSSK